MSNNDLDWLADQRPQRTEIDPGARARALAALTEHRSHTAQRGFRLGNALRMRTFGIAVATGAAAIAAAVVLSTTGSGGGGASAGRPDAHAGSPQAAEHHDGGSLLTHIGQAPRGGQATAPLEGAQKASLVHLAAFVNASPNPAGDATLVERTTNNADGSHVTVYDLYSDNGQYFFSHAATGLAAEVSAHNDLADGLFGREVAAAKLAAAGNVEQGAQDMANAPYPSRPISRTAADGNDAASPRHDVNLFDNWAWENSLDALIAGAGDPQVRAGVLQILATLPDVTVINGTSDGQPTLVLTAGAAETGPGYSEQLTINADSGVPITLKGGSSVTVDYQVSRVTLANPTAKLPVTSGTSD